MSSAPKVARRADARTLSHRVASALREEIIAGELAPGEMIAEIPTANRLGVSRLPVREAALMLEREGLLVLEGRGRRRIRSLAAQDLAEILDIRLLLEPRLTALAAEFRTAGDLSALEENLERLASAKRLARVSLLDIEFHDLIATASRHSRLAHMWRVMRGQIQLFTAALQRQRQWAALAVRESTAAAHREILDRIRAQDVPGAAACVERHLQTWKQNVEPPRRGDA